MEIRRINNEIITLYNYDPVGNIIQVTGTCPWLPGQSFTETFTYDSSDQMLTAQENQSNSYQLAVSYGNWGKIAQYNLTQTDMLNSNTQSRSLAYTYAPQGNIYRTQTLLAPYRQTGSETARFTYGINGSLRKRETLQPEPHTEYYLHNSQGNLKAYSDDVMSFAYYGYNAANTRTYKLSLYNTNLWINGQPQALHMQLQQAMFYPNTYLNFDAFGNYTKHYYNGMERVASRLGDNNTTIAIDNMLENRMLLLEEQVRNDIQELISETPQVDLPPMLDILNLQPTGTPNDIYYYHPNHLGSTAFVTDNNATITQGFLYAPFGEVTTEYNVNFGSSVIPKYSFNAKELDEETGMYYYEARYYNPPVFVSRDPLFEKYFWLSPYAYCANNPLKYVDPSGEKIVIVGEDGVETTYEPGMTYDGNDKFTSDAIAGLNFLYNNPEGEKNRVADIVNAEPVLTIIQQSIGESSRYNPYNQTLSWDNQSIDVYETGSQSAIVGFAHEIDHASISIPALDRVWKYEDGVLWDKKAYVQDCGDAKLVTLPGDMKYENSAISYENFIGNLTIDNRKLSTYFRSSYIPPKETIRTNSIFMTK